VPISRALQMSAGLQLSEKPLAHESSGADVHQILR
jgi:hypothetical protein